MRDSVTLFFIPDRSISLKYDKIYPLSGFILRRKSQCWRTSCSITGSNTVQPRIRFSVASLPKNSFWRKEKLQSQCLRSLYNSSSGLVRFWGVLKKRKRSILTSCLVWYPQRTKVATALKGFYCQNMVHQGNPDIYSTEYQ